MAELDAPGKDSRGHIGSPLLDRKYRSGQLKPVAQIEGTS